MTNYIIDDANFDFFKELTTSSPLPSNEQSECLLSKEPLTHNHIKLTCGHTFNYKPLFFELYTSKYKLNTQPRNISTIKCPYCRTHSGFLLPFIPLGECNQKITGVNHPARYCKQIHSCSWEFTAGNNKGTCCGKSAYETDAGILCNRHHKMIQGRKMQMVTHVTSEMNELSKKYTVKQLRELLRSMNLRVGGRKNVLIARYLEGLKG